MNRILIFRTLALYHREQGQEMRSRAGTERMTFKRVGKTERKRWEWDKNKKTAYVRYVREYECVRKSNKDVMEKMRSLCFHRFDSIWERSDLKQGPCDLHLLSIYNIRPKRVTTTSMPLRVLGMVTVDWMGMLWINKLHFYLLWGRLVTCVLVWLVNLLSG